MKTLLRLAALCVVSLSAPAFAQSQSSGAGPGATLVAQGVATVGGAAIAANSCAATTVAVAGVTTGMAVMVSFAGTTGGGAFPIPSAYATAGNVNILQCNLGGLAATPSAQVVNYRVFQ